MEASRMPLYRPGSVADPYAILRQTALRRSSFCPGAGLAAVGRRRLAILSYGVSILLLVALVWLAVDPEPAPLCASAGLLAFVFAVFVAEQISVRWLPPKIARSGFLTSGFPIAAFAIGVADVAVIVLLLTNYHAFVVVGDGMAPTLASGARFLYHTRVDSDELRRGAVIVFRLSDDATVGDKRLPAVARILAVPGDTLSNGWGDYLVNGKPAARVKQVDYQSRAVEVAYKPDTIVVPDGAYFVVQDNTVDQGCDSRVLSWVHKSDVRATRIFRLQFDRFLQRVE